MATKTVTNPPKALTPRRAPRKTLSMTEKGTTLTVTPAAPAKKAPRKAAAKAAPAVDLFTLEKALKSAKGVLWTMNHRGTTPPEKIAAQEAKIAGLQAEWNQVRPTSGYDGPSWVVALDVATGKVTSKRGENGAATRDLAAASRGAGLNVTIIRAS